MAYTRASGLGACCTSCAHGGSCAQGLGAVQPPPAPEPGESVYHYMERLAEHLRTEMKVAEAMKAYDAQVAAAEIAAKAAAAGYKVPPEAQAQVQRQLQGGMPTSTKMMIAAGAVVAVLLLMRRKH